MSKYSENLAKFRRNQRNKIYDRVLLQKHDDEGRPVTQWAMQHIIIGFCHDGDVCGARLNRILCGEHKTWCFCGEADRVIDITDEFWTAYQRGGRCVIDRNHTGWFANAEDRFTIIGGTRRCNWCGQWHERHIDKHTRIERRDVWTALEPV